MGSKKADMEVEDEDGVKYQLKRLDANADANFYKIYFPYFSRYLDGIINKKMKVVLWLIRNMTIANELEYSYRKIAKQSGISYQTVAETMKILMEKDFIRRTNENTLMINPRAVFRGRIDKKMSALNVYNELDKPGTPKNKQKNRPSIADTKALSKELKELEEKKKSLQNEINSLRLQLLPTDKEKKEEGGEGKNSAAQTDEQEPKPKAEDKDGAGQASEPVTYFY